jgi:hypothetical protein
MVPRTISLRVHLKMHGQDEVLDGLCPLLATRMTATQAEGACEGDLLDELEFLLLGEAADDDG